MIAKINPSKIITDHYSTFVDFNTKKRSIGDYILFLIVPLLVGFGLLYFFQELGDSLINILITVFSIFVGLLLNLLLLTFDLFKKEKQIDKALEKSESQRLQFRAILLKEIFSNVSYCIFISILLVLVLLVAIIKNPIIKYYSAFIAYFLSVHFFLTIAMLLKRIHILLDGEFPKKNSGS